MTNPAEFNLSKKVFQDFKGKDNIYFEKDVKEFIRLLKERFEYLDNEVGEICENDRYMIWNEIDKLAGEKLK